MNLSFQWKAWNAKKCENFKHWFAVEYLFSSRVILFRFGKHFELPLLVQSVVMIVVMLMMIHLCTLVRTRSEIIASKARSFLGEWCNSQYGSYMLSVLHVCGYSLGSAKYYMFHKELNNTCNLRDDLRNLRFVDLTRYLISFHCLSLCFVSVSFYLSVANQYTHTLHYYPGQLAVVNGNHGNIDMFIT